MPKNAGILRVCLPRFRRWTAAKNKTALAPPAVRAPVFPHASPVTEGLKSATQLADPLPAIPNLQ